MLSFKNWLEDTGEVQHKNLSNHAAELGSEEGFGELESKYVAGKRKRKASKFDAKNIFGMMKKKMHKDRK